MPSPHTVRGNNRSITRQRRATLHHRLFEVERIEYQLNPIFWNWTFHSLLAERWPRLADRLFPPVGIFNPSLQSVVLLSGFSGLDLVLRTATGKTASMAAWMRKRRTG